MEITLPTSWNDITLQKYINLRPVINTEMSEPKNGYSRWPDAKIVGIGTTKDVVFKHI